MTMRTAEAEVSATAERGGGGGDGRDGGGDEISAPAERGRRYATRFLFFDQAVSVSKHSGDD